MVHVEQRALRALEEHRRSRLLRAMHHQPHVFREGEEPLRQLATNAGLEGSVVVEKVKAEKKTVGFNVDTETYVDMFEAGIIDPTKVTRSALQNAASIAALMLTTEAIVADIPEKKKDVPMPPGGMDDY